MPNGEWGTWTAVTAWRKRGFGSCFDKELAAKVIHIIIETVKRNRAMLEAQASDYASKVLLGLVSRECAPVRLEYMEPEEAKELA